MIGSLSMVATVDGALFPATFFLVTHPLVMRVNCPAKFPLILRLLPGGRVVLNRTVVTVPDGRMPPPRYNGRSRAQNAKSGPD